MKEIKFKDFILRLIWLKEMLKYYKNLQRNYFQSKDKELIKNDYPIDFFYFK